MRRWFAVAVVLAGSVAAIQAGCGNGTEDSTFLPPLGEDGSIGASSGDFGSSGTSGTSGSSGDADPDALGTLVVTPPTATIAVTIVNGALTANAPVAFKASYSGQPVAAWLTWASMIRPSPVAERIVGDSRQ